MVDSSNEVNNKDQENKADSDQNFSEQEESEQEEDGREMKVDPDEDKKNQSELLTECQKDRDKFLAGWQRALADYRNLQKSLEQEKKQAKNSGREEVLEEVIRLADSFDMAFADEEAWRAVDENWRQGVEQIYGQLQAVFNSYNLRKIVPETGEEFDPSWHESVDVVQIDDSSQDGKVIAVIKNGYCLEDKVIRPAQVRVGVLNN